MSIMPSVHGEDCVIRIWTRKSINENFADLTLSVLGFDPVILRKLHKYISEPYGMVLVTGPTEAVRQPRCTPPYPRSGAWSTKSLRLKIRWNINFRV